MATHQESRVLFLIMQNMKAQERPEMCVEALHVLCGSNDAVIADKARNLLAQIRNPDRELLNA